VLSRPRHHWLIEQFPDGSNAYKYILHPAETPPQGNRKRYDLILFDILQQLKDDWGFVDIERFGLAGFSGGGQVSLSGTPAGQH